MKQLDEKNEFYTLKGYQANTQSELTPAMEDYLEMICRMAQKTPVVRIGELAHNLHVKPSSVTKMIQQLKQCGFVEWEKYSYVSITPKGLREGRYLLYRHQVLQRFLCALNGTADELEQVEKIEHFLDRNTVENLALLAVRLENESVSNTLNKPLLNV